MVYWKALVATSLADCEHGRRCGGRECHIEISFISADAGQFERQVCKTLGRQGYCGIQR